MADDKKPAADNPYTQIHVVQSGDTLSKIYLGSIKKWNDPAIVALNPGVTLPATDIVVVHRSDGSGTTNAFTTYLSAVSTDWKSKVGAGKSVNWPTGVGAKGNDGVAGQVKQLPGAIGYVDLSVALTSNIPTAELKNAAGEYITPSTAAVTTAANTAVANWPADSRQGPIVNANAPGAYPIATFTYLLYYTTQTELAKAQAFISFYYWAQTDGVQYEESLGYAPIPDSVKAVAFDSLHTVTVNGTPVWPK